MHYSRIRTVSCSGRLMEAVSAWRRLSAQSHSDSAVVMSKKNSTFLNNLQFFQKYLFTLCNFCFADDTSLSALRRSSFASSTDFLSLDNWDLSPCNLLFFCLKSLSCCCIVSMILSCSFFILFCKGMLM